MSADAWSMLVPYPAPTPIAPGYDRHHPDSRMLHAELARLAVGADWPALGWSELLAALLAVARADIPLARLLEGHVDALRILHQADVQPRPGLYGVWASRSQRTGVAARAEGEEWVLDGTLRFASGAGVLDRALVPVWPAADRHVLLDVDVTGLPVDQSQWVTAAMAVSRSHTLTFDGFRVPRSARVGPDNFYLERPGFFPGGVGVAACWAGGAARVADLAHAGLADPLPPALGLRLGQVRAHLVVAAAVLAAAAIRLTDMEGEPESRPWQQVATEARFVVAAAVHGVLDEAHRIAGPAGLAYDEDLTRAVHDLRLYVLQANADADAALLGQLGKARVGRT